jgi:hypothetical protein
MTHNNDEIIFLHPPTHVVDGLDDDYQQLLNDTQKRIVKNGFEVEFDNFSKRAEATDEWLYDLPHPNRKRWVGFIPPHFELMLDETHAVQLLINELSRSEIEIGAIVRKLLKHSPSFRQLAKAGQESGMGTNLGNLDPTLYPHAYWAKGARMFRIDPTLTSMLDKTDLGIKSPAGFVRLPYSNMFIHARPNVTLVNPASGEHYMDGLYLNQYTIDAKQIDEEWEFANVPNSLNGVLAERGLLTRDGGDVRVIEIMATGRPKDNIFDDATFNFVFVIQDPTTSIGDLFDAHVDYFVNRAYEGEAERQGLTMLNAGEREVKAMKEVIEFAVKALLYINSDDATRDKVMELSDLKMAERRTQNKAKKRKLQRRMARASDYVNIGFKGDLSHMHENEGGVKSAHWRRGHFREQRFGKGRVESKIIWLQPTMVGRNKPVSKTYNVK